MSVTALLPAAGETREIHEPPSLPRADGLPAAAVHWSVLAQVADHAENVLGDQAADRAAREDTEHHPAGWIQEEAGRLQVVRFRVDERAAAAIASASAP